MYIAYIFNIVSHRLPSIIFVQEDIIQNIYEYFLHLMFKATDNAWCNCEIVTAHYPTTSYSKQMVYTYVQTNVKEKAPGQQKVL